MQITQIKLENYTVFDSFKFYFDSGINVFIGENGTGKTHLMKLLYAATQSVDTRVSF